MLQLVYTFKNVCQLVNITKKQIHRYTEQTSGYQLGEGRGEGKNRNRRLRGTNYYV